MQCYIFYLIRGGKTTYIFEPLVPASLKQLPYYIPSNFSKYLILLFIKCGSDETTVRIRENESGSQV